MAREQAAARDGLRVMVRFTLKQVKASDLAKLIEHMEAMKADWLAEYEITQQPENQLPPGA
jgi:hypothetical protein